VLAAPDSVLAVPFASPPATIALWSFDEGAGRWATRHGGAVGGARAARLAESDLREVRR
jgi:hypothetical protein